MVGSYIEDVISFFISVVNSFDSSVCSGDSFDSSIIVISVVNYIGRGKVVYDKFVFVRFDSFSNFVGNILDRYFGLFVVGGNFGRRNYFMFFIFELFFDIIVEEEGNMGVFFGFGNVVLFDILFGELFGEDVGYILRRESDREGEFDVVFGYGGDV